MKRLSPDDLRKLKDKAADAAAKGKFDKAADLYRDVADGDPRDVGSRQKLAEMLRRAGRIPEAIQTYREVADRFGRDGLLIKAIAISKTILELDPSHGDTQAALAELYAKKAAAEGARPAQRTVVMQAMKAAGIPPLGLPAAIAPPPPPAPPKRPGTEEVVAIRLGPPEPQPDAISIDVDLGPDEAPPLVKEPDPFAPRARPAASPQVPPVLPRAPAPPPSPVPAPVAAVAAPVAGPAPTSAPPIRVELPAGDEPAATPFAQIVFAAEAAVQAGVDEEELVRLEAVGAEVAGDEPLGEPELRVEPAEAEPPQEAAELEIVVEPEPLPLPEQAAPPPVPAARPPPPPAPPAEALPPAPRPPARPPEARPPPAPPSEARPPAAPPPAPTPPAARPSAPPPPAARPLVPPPPAARPPAPPPPPARPAAPAPARMPAAAQGPARPAAAVPGLPRVPIFSDLSREAFVELTAGMVLHRAAAGEAILREGEDGTSFYVVATGKLSVTKRDETGTVVPLARLGEGDFFGEMALLSGARRAATVTAEEPAEVLEFRAEALLDVASRHPHVAQALRRFYRQRLLANAMAVSAIFRPFQRGERKLIMERFRARETELGEMVIREGEPSDGLYVILEGAVDVIKHKDGRDVVVSHLREGDLFGEMSCLRKAPASASVVVSRAGTLLRLPRREFDDLVVTYPQILELVSTLSDERAENLDAILSGHAEWTDEGLVLT